MRLIYDVGSNNGDDIPYYLHKADRVIAIEANPALTAIIAERFRDAIASGRLVVETCVVTVAEAAGPVPFYLHRDLHILSQFMRPGPSQRDAFEEVMLPAKTLMSMIRKYGTPHYVKIDVEGFDRFLLTDLFDHGIFPPYLSSESHEIEVFAALVSRGGYQAFKLVDGEQVKDLYKDHKIRTRSGLLDHSFPHHSAGPFGNDIFGPWLTAEAMFRQLAQVGLGWKDLHVSNVDLPEG